MKFIKNVIYILLCFKLIYKQSVLNILVFLKLLIIDLFFNSKKFLIKNKYTIIKWFLLFLIIIFIFSDNHTFFCEEIVKENGEKLKEKTEGFFEGVVNIYYNRALRQVEYMQRLVNKSNTKTAWAQIVADREKAELEQQRINESKIKIKKIKIIKIKEDSPRTLKIAARYGFIFGVAVTLIYYWFSPLN